jgi:hypothetical protein
MDLPNRPNEGQPRAKVSEKEYNEKLVQNLGSTFMGRFDGGSPCLSGGSPYETEPRTAQICLSRMIFACLPSAIEYPKTL